MNSHGDHSELWSYIDGLREDLGRAEERIRELEDRTRARLRARRRRRRGLFWKTGARAQYEPDAAASGLAESSYREVW